MAEEHTTRWPSCLAAPLAGRVRRVRANRRVREKKPRKRGAFGGCERTAGFAKKRPASGARSAGASEPQGLRKNAPPTGGGRRGGGEPQGRRKKPPQRGPPNQQGRPDLHLAGPLRFSFI